MSSIFSEGLCSILPPDLLQVSRDDERLQRILEVTEEEVPTSAPCLEMRLETVQWEEADGSPVLHRRTGYLFN